MFRNTTCTPTAPPPQQNSHICAHAPGQAVKLTNSTGCSNLTGTGFPYPQSTPTRRLPLPTHLSPPLPAQNSHICTHARTRSSGQTNKQQRLLYTPGRPRLGSQVQAAPNLLAGQGRVHRRGCAPVATTSTRQRRTIASAHRAHRSGIQTHKQHRLQAAPTLVAGQGRVTGSGAQAVVRTCRHHFRPPPPQNYRICTPRTRVRRSDPTNSTGYRPKSTGCPYAPGRPRPGHRQWCTGGGAHLSPPLPPASAELSHLHIARTGQAVRPKSTGCPYASGRPRPGHRHRLPLRGLATPTPTHAQAAPTHLAPLHVLVLVSAV